jgi:hypothetical protein
MYSSLFIAITQQFRYFILLERKQTMCHDHFWMKIKYFELLPLKQYSGPLNLQLEIFLYILTIIFEVIQQYTLFKHN